MRYCNIFLKNDPTKYIKGPHELYVWIQLMGTFYVFNEIGKVNRITRPPFGAVFLLKFLQYVSPSASGSGAAISVVWNILLVKLNTSTKRSSGQFFLLEKIL